MANFTDVYTGGLHVGEGLIPPVSSATFEPSLDPTRPFSIHSFGLDQIEAITNQIGLYNGVGVWSQIGAYTGIGYGVDVGGHCDAQPDFTSAAAKIDFSAALGDLNNFWRYKGAEITNETTDSTSDVRLKTDIEPYTNCLDKILNLNPVYYRWRDDIDTSFLTDKDKDKVQVGLIAQDVENIIPEVVVNHLVYDEEYKRIKYSKLTAVLIGAIKEQQDQINSLKETVEELSTKLAQCCQS